MYNRITANAGAVVHDDDENNTLIIIMKLTGENIRWKSRAEMMWKLI